MNMFTENVKRRKRGRPPGPTAQGAAARDRLYDTAIELIAARGYEATTLRDIAKEAGVSVGLLYRYFPSKQAVVIALYDELSCRLRAAGRGDAAREMARPLHLRAEDQPRCPRSRINWRFARSRRSWLAIPKKAFFRRARRSLVSAFSACSRTPSPGPAMRRNRRWPKHSAGCCISFIWPCSCGGCWTRAHTSARRQRWSSLTQQLLPSAALTLRVPPVRRFVIAVDELVREALFGSPVAGVRDHVAGSTMSIYVEILVRAPMDALWAHTQTPALHERWDLRFSRSSTCR